MLKKTAPLIYTYFALFFAFNFIGIFVVYVFQLHEVVLSLKLGRAPVVIFLIYIGITFALFNSKHRKLLTTIILSLGLLQLIWSFVGNVKPKIFYASNYNLYKNVEKRGINITNFDIYKELHKFSGQLYIGKFDYNYFGLTKERLGLFLWDRDLVWVNHRPTPFSDFKKKSFNQMLLPDEKTFYSPKIFEGDEMCLFAYGKNMFLTNSTNSICTDFKNSKD